ILDNFCWGNCAEPTKLGGLVRAAQGCYDAAKAYGVPFVSGKDSLNNEFAVDPADRQRLGLPERISIPPTLLISAVGIVRDVSRCVTMDLKQPGNLLVLAGLLTDRWELFDLEQASRVHRAVAGCIRQRLVVSAHDCSEAGAGLAVAEMAIAGLLGAQCYLPADVGLSDPLARLVCGYVLEVGPQALAGLQAALNEAGVQHVLIGRVQRPQRLQWYRDLRIAPERVRRPGRVLMNLSVAELRQAWQSPLQW
ncbi:MAG: AIR synthase-related protein, partial [Phycisphaerae bacterium]